MARKKENNKERAAALRQCLEIEYSASVMDLIDLYARGNVSFLELSWEIGNSGADLAQEYKKELEAAATDASK